MGQREQGGQQRQGIGLREAIWREGLLEFRPACVRRSRRGANCKQPLQVLDDRIQGAVLMIGRAAKLNARRPFVADAAL